VLCRLDVDVGLHASAFWRDPKGGNVCLRSYGRNCPMRLMALLGHLDVLRYMQLSERVFFKGEGDFKYLCLNLASCSWNNKSSCDWTEYEFKV
jgi:hypothetical protein